MFVKHFAALLFLYSTTHSYSHNGTYISESDSEPTPGNTYHIAGSAGECGLLVWRRQTNAKRWRWWRQRPPCIIIILCYALLYYIWDYAAANIPLGSVDGPFSRSSVHVCCPSSIVSVEQLRALGVEFVFGTLHTKQQQQQQQQARHSCVRSHVVIFAIWCGHVLHHSL